MQSVDPRQTFISSINLDESHINLHPPKIFLFGGDMSEGAVTVRSLLYNHVLYSNQFISEALVIVEEFKDWLHDSVYPDLLAFESDLAETASLVIIALESPGALAELGSFSVNEKLKEKTIIIICDDHHNQDSFIKLGPLRQLNNENILSYPYKYDETLEETFTEHLEDIVETLGQKLERNDKTEKFNKLNNGHIAFLIHDFILINRALTFSEIKIYIKELEIERNTTEIKRLLFLLKKLELIKIERRGHTDFYILNGKGSTRVSFSYKEDKKSDRTEASMAALLYYNSSNKERKRVSVLKSLMGEEA